MAELERATGAEDLRPGAVDRPPVMREIQPGHPVIRTRPDPLWDDVLPPAHLGCSDHSELRAGSMFPAPFKGDLI